MYKRQVIRKDWMVICTTKAKFINNCMYYKKYMSKISGLIHDSGFIHLLDKVEKLDFLKILLFDITNFYESKL